MLRFNLETGLTWQEFIVGRGTGLAQRELMAGTGTGLGSEALPSYVQLAGVLARGLINWVRFHRYIGAVLVNRDQVAVRC